MRAALLPRPLSFAANSLHFAGGLLVAWGEGQWHTSLAFVLLWFIAQEGLVQQAKYLWNDLRDQARDRALPANASRPYAQTPITHRTHLHLLARWGGGLLLGLWLAPACGALLLGLTLLQLLYERWAKPHAQRHPLAPLAIVGLGAAGKFLGGALAAGWPVADARLWSYGGLFFGMGLVYGSTLWRVEALYLRQRQRPFQRGQSAYFARHGRRWLHIGSVLIVLTGLGLWLTAPSRLASATAVGTLILLLGLCVVNGRVTYEQFYLLHWRRRKQLHTVTASRPPH